MDAQRIYFPCFIFYCGVIHRFAFYSRVQIKVIFLFAIFELIGDQFYHFSNVTLIDWNWFIGRRHHDNATNDVFDFVYKQISCGRQVKLKLR